MSYYQQNPTFPSFAPSLAQSPKQFQELTRKSIYQNQNQIHKISIHIPDSLMQSVCDLNLDNQSTKIDQEENLKEPSKSSVRVFCRLRNNIKQAHNYKHDSNMIDDGENCYSFDHIFGKFSNQQLLYSKIAHRHLNDFFIGKNSTIFAYGQTGSGKTYTMFGDLKNPAQFGIIPRVLEQIFDRNNSNDIISCSMLQIYNQKIMDLFTYNQKSTQSELKLKQINQSVFVQGLTEVCVEDQQQLMGLIQFGHKARKIASTYNNDTSSRSHTILFIYRTYICQDVEHKCKLCFIDLAGSQNVRKSGVKGQTLEETKKINLSLSSLGNVVHALTSNSDHIPYRNSKLTRILKDSLSGETNTSIITTCSTDKQDYNQTISTIKFAVRAKRIKNKKKLDNVQMTMEDVVKKLKKQLQQTKKELDYYKLKEQYQKCTITDIPQESIQFKPLKSLKLSNFTAVSRLKMSQTQSLTLKDSQFTNSIKESI